MTPEQRKLWDEDIARSRSALVYWRKFAPPFYSRTTEARVAAAEQLEDCEALLREIGLAFAGEDGNVAMSEETYLPWIARLDVLGIRP